MSATYGARHASPVAESAAVAARTLYERYGQRVFTFCVSRLRDAQEAQDATQTTFLYALRALDNGTVPRFELAWLLTIAKNVCRHTRRSLKRRESRLVHADVSELDAAAASISQDMGEELAWLRNALEQLPKNQRRAILLREWQGLSYADIAAELQLSVGAVETLLFRARRTLEAQLKRAKAGLGAIDFGWLGLVFRGARKSAALKAAVVGAGVAVAVGPIAEKELRAPARAGRTGLDGVALAGPRSSASAVFSRSEEEAVTARRRRPAALTAVARTRARARTAPPAPAYAAPGPAAPFPPQIAPAPARQHEASALQPVTSVVDTAIDDVADAAPPARPALEQTRTTLSQLEVPAVTTPGAVP